MLDALLLFDLLSIKLLIALTFRWQSLIDEWNVVYLHLPVQSRIVVKSLFKPLFLYYCSPHWVGHLLFFISIFKKCESSCSLMLFMLKLHFHAKSMRYFSNGWYKLVTFWMIVQWTWNNWHKESFRVRTTNKHVRTQARKHVNMPSTWARKHVKHASMPSMRLSRLNLMWL